jgi:hypothetical protein
LSGLQTTHSDVDSAPQDSEGRDGPAGPAGAGPPGRFKGAIGLTVRLYQADFALLVLAAAVGVVVTVVVSALLGITTSERLAVAGRFGVRVVTSGGGREVGLDAPALVWGLVSVAVSAWVVVTMAHLLLRHVRTGVRPALRDVTGGLPFWGWAVVAGLLLQLFDAATATLSALVSSSLSPMSLVQTVVGLVVSTVCAFYAQLIVDERRNGAAALYGSYLLVRRAGFWSVLGMYILAGLCVLPVLIVFSVVVLIFGGDQRALILQTGYSLVIGPLSVAFTTVIYFLVRDARAEIEAVATPVG